VSTDECPTATRGSCVGFNGSGLSRCLFSLGFLCRSLSLISRNLPWIDSSQAAAAQEKVEKVEKVGRWYWCPVK
jgi:hypothetical protein